MAGSQTRARTTPWTQLTTDWLSLVDVELPISILMTYTSLIQVRILTAATCVTDQIVQKCDYVPLPKHVHWHHPIWPHQRRMLDSLLQHCSRTGFQVPAGHKFVMDCLVPVIAHCLRTVHLVRIPCIHSLHTLPVPKCEGMHSCTWLRPGSVTSRSVFLCKQVVIKLTWFVQSPKKQFKRKRHQIWLHRCYRWHHWARCSVHCERLPCIVWLKQLNWALWSSTANYLSPWVIPACSAAWCQMLLLQVFLSLC